ncbi:hypothetical protein IV203_027772 [Nitzschia inconspicua]|uniref:Uncharacterized protein n=1 Tax=Nitzschia inconspicua TaxID=303405 RepID=A0A9K3LZG3_9STRA|nr:hypothetical protein IV203_027772 [Nitzschia inconspicua]
MQGAYFTKIFHRSLPRSANPAATTSNNNTAARALQDPFNNTLTSAGVKNVSTSTNTAPTAEAVSMGRKKKWNYLDDEEMMWLWL